MRRFPPLFPSLAFVASTLLFPAMAQSDQTLYIGTYNGPKSKGIYRSVLNETTGQLSKPQLVMPADNPSFLAFSPNGRYIYAISETASSYVSAFEINEENNLTMLGSRPTDGSYGCHLSIDPTGKTLLAANYGTGNVASFPILANGSVGERTSLIQNDGSGPNLKRQEKPHAHSIYADPASRFVYSCDLGTDQVSVYKLNSVTAILEKVSFASVPSGGGPRHFAFSSKGFAFANNELTSTISTFERDSETGALTLIDTVSSLPAGAEIKDTTTAEIFVHPSEKWLYVSNRSRHTITQFSIEVDGILTFVSETPVPSEPRNFAISADGKWMIVGGQTSNQLGVFKIDVETGRLSSSGENVEVGTPVCVVFAPNK